MPPQFTFSPGLLFSVAEFVECSLQLTEIGEDFRPPRQSPVSRESLRERKSRSFDMVNNSAKDVLIECSRLAVHQADTACHGTYRRYVHFIGL